VARRVPTVHRDVATAAEGHPIVDHHHLLVVAGAQGHGVVQAELDRRALEPLARLVREELLADTWMVLNYDFCDLSDSLDF
jgi:hypothetical protein